MSITRIFMKVVPWAQQAGSDPLHDVRHPGKPKVLGFRGLGVMIYLGPPSRA